MYVFVIIKFNQSSFTQTIVCVYISGKNLARIFCVSILLRRRILLPVFFRSSYFALRSASPTWLNLEPWLPSLTEVKIADKYQIQCSKDMTRPRST